MSFVIPPRQLNPRDDYLRYVLRLQGSPYPRGRPSTKDTDILYRDVHHAMVQKQEVIIHVSDYLPAVSLQGEGFIHGVDLN